MQRNYYSPPLSQNVNNNSNNDNIRRDYDNNLQNYQNSYATVQTTYPHSNDIDNTYGTGDSVQYDSNVYRRKPYKYNDNLSSEANNTYQYSNNDSNNYETGDNEQYDSNVYHNEPHMYSNILSSEPNNTDQYSNNDGNTYETGDSEQYDSNVNYNEPHMYNNILSARPNNSFRIKPVEIYEQTNLFSNSVDDNANNLFYKHGYVSEYHNASNNNMHPVDNSLTSNKTMPAYNENLSNPPKKIANVNQNSSQNFDSETYYYETPKLYGEKDYRNAGKHNFYLKVRNIAFWLTLACLAYINYANLFTAYYIFTYHSFTVSILLLSMIAGILIGSIYIALIMVLENKAAFMRNYTTHAAGRFASLYVFSAGVSGVFATISLYVYRCYSQQDVIELK